MRCIRHAHRPPWRAATGLALACALAAAPASAHDTWFAAQPSPAGRVTLALGTGNAFPRQETGIDAKHLVQRGCRSGTAALPLTAIGDAPQALLLQVSAAAGTPLTCWAQSEPFEVTLAPDKIAVYWRDIQASPAVREAWSRMRARGVAWRERYAKHARIELNPAAGAMPVTMAMDVLLEAPAQTPRVGQTLQFRVLRDGQPLPGLAVELRGERSALGIWRRTDAEGRVRIAAPLAGRWVLRGTDLRVSELDPDRWDSRFVTLAFDVREADAADTPGTAGMPGTAGTADATFTADANDTTAAATGAATTAGAVAAQNGSSLKSNTRSASQTPATPAIDSEPPASVVRR